MSRSLSRRMFFNIWQKHRNGLDFEALVQEILTDTGLLEINDQYMPAINQKIRLFSIEIAKRWKKCRRTLSRFLTTNDKWLSGPNIVLHTVQHDVQEEQPQKPSTSRGRPMVSMEDASERTKKRRVHSLVSSHTAMELVVAAEVAVRKSGDRDSAALIRDIVNNPGRATVIKKVLIKDIKNQQRSLSREEALAYYIDSRSTCHTYRVTRNYCIRSGNNVYPSYYCVQRAKRDCMPPDTCLMFDETSAETNLQAMLDLTISRLLTAHMEAFSRFSGKSLTVVYKWGGDGSSGYSRYHQKRSSSSSTDENLFVFSFVPIRVHETENVNSIVWFNESPSSTRFCRPIKLLFAKETTELVQKETQKKLDQIANLQETCLKPNDTLIFNFQHSLLLTMVDGKICNILTETKSSSRCYICGCTGKDMNKITEVKNPNKTNYSFGLSTLHAWIRSFECFLHISYKLEKKVWRLNEDHYKDRKNKIIEKFEKELGWIVDRPKPGFGSTNTGNLARKFFANHEKSASITELDSTLIYRMNIILRTLSSGYTINLENYEKYIIETRLRYLELYPWYNMPVTLHKIFYHSVDIIKHHLLPIGQLSEEAQEARNKDCKRFRLSHTRRNSRRNTNIDLFTMLTVSSDPLINALRETPKRKKDLLPDAMLPLINETTETELIDICESVETSEAYTIQDDELDDDSCDSE